MKEYKKKFVTLFPNAENVHLTKDVGMIPYILCKYFNYDSYIACKGTDEEYAYLNKEVKGLNKINIKNSFLGQLKYIFKNAKKIDILNMYHLSIHNSLLCFYLYKKINKKGVTYLKLDLDYNGLNSIKNYSGIKLKIIRYMVKYANIISAESQELCREMQKVTGREIIYIPNGLIRQFEIKNKIKENYFLTVGRLGSKQKATEVLIDAYEKILNKCDWNLHLVGSMEGNIGNYLQNKYRNNSELEKRVIYKGAIKDRIKLYNEYEKASVFVMPSRWEGFPLALLEAAANDCYLIVSDKIPPAKDITDSEKYGKIVPADDTDLLAQAMINSTNMELDRKQYEEFLNKYFDWKKICNKLDNKIILEMGEKNV